jgi:hypothetical protein
MKIESHRTPLQRARAKLTATRRPDRTLAAVGAAALFAFSALAFATAAILAPPIVIEHTAPPTGR